MKHICLLLILLLATSCSSEKEKAGVLSHYIPDETSLLIRSSNFSTLASDINNNSFLSAFSKMPFYHFFLDNLKFTQYLNPVSEVLISTSSENDSIHHLTLIARQHPGLFEVDSIPEKTIETLTYQDISLQRLTLKNQTLFTTIVDSVFIASSSQKTLESILLKRKNKKLKALSTPFESAYSTLGAQDLSIMIQGERFMKLYQSAFPKTKKLPPLASWVALDAQVQPGLLKVNGIALAQDTIPQLLNIFKGTTPQKNLLAMVTPPSASGFVSYTYDDFDRIQNNLQDFQQKNDSIPEYTALFASLNEMGVISKNSEKIVAMHAISGSITKDYLEPLLENHSSFREVSIKKLKDTSIFKNALYPLITSTPKYAAQLEDFFVFGESPAALEEIITHFLNETTLGNISYYKEHMAQLSSESSILLIGILPHLKEQIAKNISSPNNQKVSDLNVSKHPLFALQFVHDSHFAHVNGVVIETQAQKRSSGVSQGFAINLENELLSRPQFFSNPISKGKDIVVQDVTNKLHLISAQGKVQWSKQLDEAIIGDIQEVDLLRNGRIQMAFVTKNNFYILDRNGKEVNPFPLKFKDDITQPLAIFDYDSNRNYRFVITQAKDLLMYDSKGKTVRGFTFKKAGSKVVLPPKHIRISNKDYILIAEEKGKLHILHRTGKSRIGVDARFDFGESQIYSEDVRFVFLDAKDQKIAIDQNGKVSTQKLNSVSKNVVWELLGNTKATLDDNILRINNQKVELPFGVYTAPKISVSNRRVLVSITDLQQQRTYVYNSLGKLLSNFPVYGTSMMELGDATNNGKPNGIVKGGDKEIIFYEIQ